MTESSGGIAAVGRLIADWQAIRAELVEIERAEHPDTTDRFGRVWTWKSKDLYRHCGTAAPYWMIDNFGLPTQAALDNPNYDLCDICLDGRERHASKCKPEWKCSHTICQSADGDEVTMRYTLWGWSSRLRITEPIRITGGSLRDCRSRRKQFEADYPDALTGIYASGDEPKGLTLLVQQRIGGE